MLPLKNENKIYTCAGDATIAFISAEDIAALAIKGLTSEKPFNCDFTVHGPELVTHDQVREYLSFWTRLINDTTHLAGREIQQDSREEDRAR